MYANVQSAAINDLISQGGRTVPSPQAENGSTVLAQLDSNID